MGPSSNLRSPRESAQGEEKGWSALALKGRRERPSKDDGSWEEAREESCYGLGTEGCKEGAA